MSGGHSRQLDVGILGGGIVGCAVALALSRRPGVSLVVLEAEAELAAHQTGHNSGVIHSGLYYAPGSLKARLSAAGRERLFAFCAEQGLPVERCGKLVIAVDESQLPALAELQRRGEANGLAGLRWLGPEELREREPHAAGIAGLLVPQTGIVDYGEVTRAYARLFVARGGEVRTGCRVTGVRRLPDGLVLETGQGEVRVGHLINCAGLQSDRVARLAGQEPRLQIVPFRGEYYQLTPAREGLVRSLIYPVPDPRFPFLGVHFTRRVGGGVEAGPNAVLALAREGYRWGDVSARDLLELGTYPGFWRLALRHWRMGLGETWRSLAKPAFVAALQRLIPELTAADLQPGGAGVRAQALDPSGKLVDDFCILEGERMIHVLNAPSPAATASLPIGEEIARRAGARFGLPEEAPGGRDGG